MILTFEWLYTTGVGDPSSITNISPKRDGVEFVNIESIVRNIKLKKKSITIN